MLYPTDKKLGKKDSFMQQILASTLDPFRWELPANEKWGGRVITIPFTVTRNNA